MINYYWTGSRTVMPQAHTRMPPATSSWKSWARGISLCSKLFYLIQIQRIYIYICMSSTCCIHLKFMVCFERIKTARTNPGILVQFQSMSGVFPSLLIAFPMCFPE